MARFLSELVMVLKDAVSAPARQVRQSISGITQSIKETNVAALEASSKSLSRTMRGVTVELAASTAGLVAYAAALMKPISAATEFQSKMTTIGQKADYSRRQSLMLGASIQALAPKVNQYAKDIAEGVDVLAGKGLDPKLGLNLLKPIGMAATAYEAEIKDLAEATYAVYGNLRVPITDAAQALDIMAKAGKDGSFELKDMAKYFPTLAAAAQGLGQEGVPAVADLAAALQIAARGAGSADEAATNVGNLLQKITAKQTVKAFKDMGVDLVGSLKALEREGRTPIEAIAELTNKTLKGDMSRLGYLFEDAQVQKALRPLIRDINDYRAIRAKALSSKGTVNRDFAERMKDEAQRAKQSAIAAERLKTVYGTALLPIFGALAAAVTPFLQGLADLVAAHPQLVSAVTATVGAYLVYRVATGAVTLANLAAKKGLVDLALGFLGAGTGSTSAANLVGRAGGVMRGAFSGIVRLATGVADALIFGVAGGGMKAFSALSRLRGLSFASLGRGIRSLGAPLANLGARIVRLPGLVTGVMGLARGAVMGFLGAFSPASIIGFGRGLLGLMNPVSIVRGALMGLRLALIGTGIGAIVVGIGLAAAFVIRHWRGFVTFFQGVGRGFAAAIAPVRPALQPFIDGIRQLFGWIGGLFKGKPGEDWSQYGVAVGKALGSGVLALVNFARWVGECIDKVRTFFGLKGKPPGADIKERVGWFGLGRGGDNKPPPAPGAPKPRPVPARAKGGPIIAGSDYLVGENGPEIVRPDRNARVYPNGVSPPDRASASPSAARAPATLQRGPITIHLAPVFHIQGAANPRELANATWRLLEQKMSSLDDSGLFDAELRGA